MIGMSNHLLSIVFRFHYHSQEVIGSLGTQPEPTKPETSETHPFGPSRYQSRNRWNIWSHLHLGVIYPGTTKGPPKMVRNNPYYSYIMWGFPKMLVITQQPWVFPTKNDHFGVFWGYHHLRKHHETPISLGNLDCEWDERIVWGPRGHLAETPTDWIACRFLKQLIWSQELGKTSS